MLLHYVQCQSAAAAQVSFLSQMSIRAHSFVKSWHFLRSHMACFLKGCLCQSSLTLRDLKHVLCVQRLAGHFNFLWCLPLSGADAATPA